MSIRREHSKPEPFVEEPDDSYAALRRLAAEALNTSHCHMAGKGPDCHEAEI